MAARGIDGGIADSECRRDQELRFTVHDSPDYYQLKVSVFNDDKKTELIGETWVSLQDVLVPGGGQNDLWHNLNYRGKYAGEIRIEITYYDSRPKQEKPKERIREGTPSAVDGGRESLGGPRGLKEKVKRRPLPNDPITGAAPTPIETPERALPQQPRAYANGTPDHQPQPRVYPAAPPEHVQNQQTRGYGTSDYVQPPQQRAYATPEHVQPQPPRSAYNIPPAYVQAQSPLQQLEYQTPTHGRSQSQQVQGRYGPSGMDQAPLQADYNTPPPHSFSQSQQPQGRHAPPAVNGYAQSPGMMADSQNPRDAYNDRYDPYDQPREDSYAQSNISSRYEEPHMRGRPESRDYAPQQATYNLPPPDEYEPPPSPGGPPPPPPVHRVVQSSAAAASSPSYGFPPPNPAIQQFDHLRQDSHRHPMPAYPANPQYQPYTPPRQYAPPPPQTYPEPSHESPQPRHNSYEAPYTSMQPTVEDAPPSPGPFAAHRSSQRMAPYSDHDRRYDDVPSPAPLNLNGRGSAASGIYNANANVVAYNSNSYPVNNEIRQADAYQPPPPQASKDFARQPQPQSYQEPRQAPEQRWSSDEPAYVPALPSSLVAGIDPAISREIAERIYSDTRSRDTYAPQPSSTQQSQPRYTESQQYRPQYRALDDAHAAFAAPSDRQARGIANTYTPVVKPRALSPSPSPSPTHSNSHTVRRKSVSPHPHPSPSPMHPNARDPSPSPRRLSAVPFSPDDYTSLNPQSPVAAPDAAPDPDAKIILHDGREVDPSDHLPETSWAALPPNLTAVSRESRVRPSPAGAQPTGGGRRMERRSGDGRPQSMAGVGNGAYMSGALASSPVAAQAPPPAPGRNRLQKKSNRVSNSTSAQPIPLPLSPISANSYQNQNGTYSPDARERERDRGFEPRRTLPRAQTVDFASVGAGEKGYAGYGSVSSGGGAGGYRGPQQQVVQHSRSGSELGTGVGGVYGGGGEMGVNGGGMGGGSSSQDNAWALLEEMRRIDLGSGRARRRNGGVV